MNDFEGLIGEFGGELRRMCLSAFKSRDDGEEVYQLSLIEANRDFHQFRGASRGELESWARRLFRNNIKDYRRRLARWRERGETRPPRFDEMASAPVPAPSTTGPEQFEPSIMRSQEGPWTAGLEELDCFIKFTRALSDASGESEGKVARAFRDLLWAEGNAAAVAAEWGVKPPTFQRHKARMQEVVRGLVERGEVLPEEVADACRFMLECVIAPSMEQARRWANLIRVTRDLSALQELLQRSKPSGRENGLSGYRNRGATTGENPESAGETAPGR